MVRRIADASEAGVGAGIAAALSTGGDAAPALALSERLREAAEAAWDEACGLAHAQQVAALAQGAQAAAAAVMRQGGGGGGAG